MVTFKFKIHIKDRLQNLHESREWTNGVITCWNRDWFLLMHHHHLELLLPVRTLQPHQGEVVREAKHQRRLPQAILCWPIISLQRRGVVVQSQDYQHGIDNFTVAEVEVGQPFIHTRTRMM